MIFKKDEWMYNALRAIDTDFPGVYWECQDMTLMTLLSGSYLRLIVTNLHNGWVFTIYYPEFHTFDCATVLTHNQTTHWRNGETIPYLDFVRKYT